MYIGPAEQFSSKQGRRKHFQDWYGENHPISRADDGGTEGPE